MHCPRCQSEGKVKNGIVNDKQRYRCIDCGCNYTRSDSHGKPVQQKIMAVSLHLCGMSMNSIAAFIGVSAQSVMRWVRWAAETLAPVPKISPEVTEIEMDEMHHFLLKKVKNFGFGKCWIISANHFAPGGLVLVMHPQDKKF